MDQAYASGIRYFDTAPGYGMAEKLLLDWLTERKLQDITIATKWGYIYVADFKKDAKVHEVKDHSYEKLLEQWGFSKSFDKTLKLYQVHSAGFDTDILTNTHVHEELARIKRDHGILIGITSSGAQQVNVIRKALAVKVNGESLIDAFQVTYNLLDQSLVELVSELKVKNKLLIIKEALANGRLFPNTKYEQYNALYNVLTQLAEHYQVGIDAIALRFVIDSISPYKVLSGASTNEQLSQNMKCLTFQLSEEEVSQLKKFSVEPEFYWNERKELSWN